MASLTIKPASNGSEHYEDEEWIAEFADSAAVVRLLETEGGMGQLLCAGTRGMGLVQCVLAFLPAGQEGGWT